MIMRSPTLRLVSRRRRLRRESSRRCAVCGKTIADPSVERNGRHFCSEWHAARYFPRKSLWRRLWEGGDRSVGGGGCCR